jgi:hypothetical protein
MINRFLIFIVLLSLNFSVQAQTCTPLAATGTPLVSPPTENLACVERGILFSEVIYIENFNTFNTTQGTAQLNFLRIDSFTNLPCDLQWSISPSDSLSPAQTGCISIYGTTNDSVGQYRVNIYVTVGVTHPTFGYVELSDEAESLVQTVQALSGGTPLGVNYKYFLRVIQAGNSCPVLDTSNAATNLIACSPLTGTISSFDTICSGVNTSFNVVPYGGTPPYSYKWSPSGIFNNDIIANPMANTSANFTASVKIYDNAGDSVTITKPIAVEVCSGMNDKVLKSFTVMPNPSNGIFQLRTNYNDNFDVQVFSMDGKIVFEGKYVADNNSFALDLSGERKGVYILKLTSEAATGIKRIVLE